jgi:hypothetical protein
MLIGPFSEVKTRKPVVGRRQPKPSRPAYGVHLNGGPKITFCQSVVAGYEVPLALHYTFVGRPLIGWRRQSGQPFLVFVQPCAASNAEGAAHGNNSR